MKIHPYADLFPMMNDTEFVALCEDIKENGLRDPIIIYENTILDGRNRWKACQETKSPHRFQNYHGNDPKAFVISKNFHRRHLNESQRAMLAAKLLNGGTTEINPPVPIGTEEIKAVAASVQASPRSTRRALQVIESGDTELIEKVQDGKVAVSVAVKQVAPPKSKKPLQSAEAISAATYNHIEKISGKLIKEDWRRLGVLVADHVE